MRLARADRQGAHRVAFDKNKKTILKTQNEHAELMRVIKFDRG